MALTIETNSTETWDIEQFMDHVAKNVDLRDEGSVAAAAPALRSLANNRVFLREVIHRELLNWRLFQEGNAYTAQTMLLARGKGYFLRANIWMPPAQNPQLRQAQNALFLYTVPHDHNFTFLTVGYWGPGYETEIYEYDSDRIVGYAGERVDLRFLERTWLPAGKVMMYRAGRDIHSQLHPEAFSISLNLMITTPDMALREQFFFDLEQRRIANYVPIGTASRVALCNIARFVGNTESCATLEQLAKTHPCHRTRAAAYDSLSQLAGSDGDVVWSRAIRDKHPFVQRAARAALNREEDAIDRAIVYA